ncbi:DUF6221 family protein [Embleya sp. NPDC005971]|uniref:DUF6221 family protein n=1 Tax=Embleya sp. NPDC005971 TaxID=3156724 RepID=UPI0033F21DA6
MTADLVAFLRARLDEAEREAQRLDGEEWTWSVSKPWDGPATGHISAAADPYGRIAVLPGGDAAKYEDRIRHIARYDPARGLRDVAARRAILAEHRHLPMDGCAQCADGVRSIGTASRVEWIVNRAEWPCPTVRHLATVYDDHPDYQEAWRP